MLLRFQQAEGEGFELTLAFTKPVFKTGALNRSATLPFLAQDCHFITSDHHGQDALIIQLLETENNTGFKSYRLRDAFN